MSVSTRERISHVIRRLGIGARAGVVAATATMDDAIATGLDLTSPAPPPPDITPPEDAQAARGDNAEFQRATQYWLEQMVAGERLIEERLVWFWHDHFATSIRKVQFPYLMWQQQLTIREHATGSFADLLRAVARDPAMLIYLDGVGNHRGAINENFGREVMELFTIGRGNYSEEDVLAAARSFSGWVVNVPGRRRRVDAIVEPWSSFFVRPRHDDGDKTLLGVTGRHDMDRAIDILLDQPATGERIASKLYTELVGLPPDDATTSRLGATFRAGYQVMDLVSEIAADPEFTSDDAVRARVRTPLERAVGILQGYGATERSGRALFGGLRNAGYVPYNPPNVAGYPKGARLLGPHRLIHGFDFTAMLDPRNPVTDADEAFGRLGVFDVSDDSRAVVAAAATEHRAALALTSPEYAVTGGF